MAFLLSLAHTPAAHAWGDTSYPRMGFGSWDWWLNASDYDRMENADAQLYRTALRWRLIEPTDDSWSWASYDAVFTNTATNNVQILPVLFDSPTWIDGNIAYPPAGAGELADYREYVTKLAQRYGPNGDFWQANPGLPYLPVRAWQVWNEANDEGSWPTPNAGEYAQLLRDTKTALRAVDPDALIVFGGPAITSPQPATFIPVNTFISQVLSEPDGPSLFDVMSSQPYYANAATVLSNLQSVRSTLDSNGAADKQIWVTEFGWEADNVGEEATQQTKLETTVDTLLANKDALKLGTLIWYAYRDVGGGYENLGLLYEDRTEKAGWASFASRATANQTFTISGASDVLEAALVTAVVGSEITVSAPDTPAMTLTHAVSATVDTTALVTSTLPDWSLSLRDASGTSPGYMDKLSGTGPSSLSLPLEWRLGAGSYSSVTGTAAGVASGVAVESKQIGFRQSLAPGDQVGQGAQYALTVTFVVVGA